MTDWSRPQEVSDLLIAFPATIEHLMPTWEEIPEEFRNEDSVWCAFQSSWFFHGLPETTAFHCREGIVGNDAVRHLTALQRSYCYKHQHKVAAVAYLASLWFDAVVVSATEVYGEDGLVYRLMSAMAEDQASP